MAHKTTTVVTLTIVSNGPKFNIADIKLKRSAKITSSTILSSSTEHIKKVRTLEETAKSCSLKLLKNEITKKFNVNADTIKNDRYTGRCKFRFSSGIDANGCVSAYYTIDISVEKNLKCTITVTGEPEKKIVEPQGFGVNHFRSYNRSGFVNTSREIYSSILHDADEVVEVIGKWVDSLDLSTGVFLGADNSEDHMHSHRLTNVGNIRKS